MSHDYYVHCSKCHESSERYNRVQDKLINAVKESFPLFLLSKTGWGTGLWSIEYDYLRDGLADFIVQHYGCRSFEVRGEYSTDPIITVQPDEPIFLHQGAYI